MTAKSLRLVAQDEEDLKILSAHLQDAILRVSDLTYLPRQRRFALVLNRYCWEGCDENALGTRVLCGLHFDDVLAVKSRGLARDDEIGRAHV